MSPSKGWEEEVSLTSSGGIGVTPPEGAGEGSAGSLSGPHYPVGGS